MKTKNYSKQTGFSVCLFSLLLLCSAVLLPSCQETAEEPSLSIQPDITSLRFSADGLSAFSGADQVSPSFIVTTNAVSWETEVTPEEASWCHVSKSPDGRGFTVSADENESKESPVAATVTVTAGNAEPVVISVTQDGIAVNTLALSPDTRELSIPADGGSETYTVETDAREWDAVSDADWCTVAKDEEEDNFTITVNSTSSTEEKPAATVTVTAGNADPIMITVSQEARNTLEISPETNSVAFPAEGGSETFTVTTNAGSWEAVTESDWCEVTVSSGSFTITAGENGTDYEREPTIVTITAGNALRTISVTQEAREAQVYRLGDYYPDPNVVYENGTLVSGTAAQGIVIWLDPESEQYDASGDVPQGTSGKIVSIDAVANPSLDGLTWGPSNNPTGATDEEDGRNNMAAIQSYITDSGLTGESFPAFWWVVSEMNGRQEWNPEDGWYLPALLELKQMCAGMFGMVYENLTEWINGGQYAIIPGYNEEAAKNAKAEFMAKRIAAGGTEFSAYVWSSTENPDDPAYTYALNFNFGQYTDWHKEWGAAYTCAIRKF